MAELKRDREDELKVIDEFLGFQRRYWWLKVATTPAWRLLKEWQLREPLEVRTPASPELVRAVISVAFSWDWMAVGALVWLGFHCILRPGELCELRKTDLRLDLGGGSTASYRGVGVCVINKPKTRKTAARRQHVLIEDKALMWFLSLFLGLLRPLEKIWPFSPATFSKRLERILEFLKCVGAFPAAGLRAGGATHHFLTFRDVQLLRLRGRWVVLKSLEHYVRNA